MRFRSSLFLPLIALAFASPAHAQWKAGGVAFPITPFDDQTALLPDGQGGAFMFFLLPGGVRTPRAQHMLSTGTPDPLDGPTGRVVALLPYGMGRASAISDGADGMLVLLQRCAAPQAHTQCWETGETRLVRWRSGTPALGWPDSGVALGPSWTTGPDVPAIVGGGDGGAVVLRGDALTRWTGACTTPWTPDAGQLGVRVSTGTQPKIEMKIAPDGTGGAWAVWAQDVPFYPLYRRIYLNHVNSAGQRRLGSLGMVLTEQTDMRASGIGPDGFGGVFVAWSLRMSDGANLVDSVFVQHVDADGAPWWDPDGVPAGHTWADGDVSLQACGEDAVTLGVQDAGGHGLVQKIASAAPGWPGSPAGLAVGIPGLAISGPGWQARPDGSLFVGWSDSRSGSHDPRVTLVEASGLAAPGWTLDGTVLANRTDNEYFAGVVPGADPDEAIVLWGRPSPVYIGLLDWVVQKVTTGGVLAVPPPPPALALGSPWPNPARDGWYVSFRLPGPDDAVLELFDVAGRRLRRAAIRVEDAGPRQVRLDATGLAPGVYRVRLRAAAGERTRAVVLSP
jgi:hypothetical protein